MSSLNPSTAVLEAAAVRQAEAAAERASSALSAVESVIYGQRAVVENALVTLFAGGHGLLVGVPGLAKTKLVETLGVVLGLEARRIQFTPDLMPADILGAEVLETAADGTRAFRFIRGPVFAQLLMADEINRASPRTQSALATQNPLEQEGTYPLPEAQLDRFLMQIDVGYPDLAAERRMLFETTGERSPEPQAVLGAADLMEIQALVRRLPVGDSVVEAILRLVRAARPGPEGDKGMAPLIAWGPGPRASQALMLTTRARALVEGRLAPSVEDVLALAEPVLQHRMALTFAARAEGLGIRDVIGRLKAVVG